MDGGEMRLPSFTLHRLPTLADHLGGGDRPAAAIPNPIARHPLYHPSPSFFISDNDVAFDPSGVRAAIVTCGGLCPGTNTVVRELVVGLWELYGVRAVFGVRNGYHGFYSEGEEPLPLEPATVRHWHKAGGTALGASRGGFDLARIVDGIERRGFNQVYAVGGDGTMRGLVEILREARRRGLAVAVAGVPKTVDNDVGVIDRSFGFHTAVDEAQRAIAAAHVEAESAANGVGLVKLMGRSAGHIALHATLSSRDVDCCLIPEEDLYLRGPGGLFEFLYRRLKRNGHVVVVVAEGAGQRLIPRPTCGEQRRDESGNPAFLDVGAWLKAELRAWWAEEHAGEPLTVKYIDPTYMIRAPVLHAAGALGDPRRHGRVPGFVPGPINGNYGYIPVDEVAEARNPVDTRDHKWAWVRSVTNQPDFAQSTEDKALAGLYKAV
ncbi:hypothetical protein C2845_PM03G01020 [Panicum miliaceum]|uniref:Phosphofructokinase domain-containing protein n=1 Tax=Panicum miliaceum TaxID=4540 RepID=A0A3L6T8L1_PANMI|nr:hypothetical protein C2845_PM03G01020 [Panicum miliaceum]